ncbi:hypothetical protein JVT61DRAFT_10049 [Boletus reticuloceps]|uniref:Uncharacterized protein n=1 Tax=Boletus reticuloceps TaxID=495285 RepID=A0A8I3AEM3_9AGAM|nr:hypothetical protein JVT61DRAFT_10049 [Boletus reticuloceps]
MTNLVRSAKSGNGWTQSDLRAYNIKVVYQDAATFFGGPLPQPTTQPNMLRTELDPTNDQDDDLHIFLALLQIASRDPGGDETAVVDFVIDLFHKLGYSRKGRVHSSRWEISSLSCGEWVEAMIDVCLLDYPLETIQLLVQGDRQDLDPEPPLIAKAIAAYSVNNNMQHWLPALEEQMLPGITMTGTSPTFYKIPVTSALVRAVEQGQFPAEQTVVHAHLPELPRPDQRFIEGMQPLDNRYIMFSCFETFRQFI